jgi:hypothetical protein
MTRFNEDKYIDIDVNMRNISKEYVISMIVLLIEAVREKFCLVKCKKL